MTEKKEEKQEGEWLPIKGKHRWRMEERVPATSLRPSFVAKKCKVCDTIKYTHIKGNRAWNTYTGGGSVCTGKSAK